MKEKNYSTPLTFAFVKVLVLESCTRATPSSGDGLFGVGSGVRAMGRHLTNEQKKISNVI